jgi:hypothetical protein
MERNQIGMKVSVHEGPRSISLGPVKYIKFTFPDGTATHYRVTSWHERASAWGSDVYELDTFSGQVTPPLHDFVNKILAKLPENYDDDDSDETIVMRWVDDQVQNTERRIDRVREELQSLVRDINKGPMDMATRDTLRRLEEVLRDYL